MGEENARGNNGSAESQHIMQGMQRCKLDRIELCIYFFCYMYVYNVLPASCLYTMYCLHHAYIQCTACIMLIYNVLPASCLYTMYCLHHAYIQCTACIMLV